MTWDIAPVGPNDVNDLLALPPRYRSFYEVAPPDAALVALIEALIEDRSGEGVQLLARDPDARGQGLADHLIAACVERRRARGDIASLNWQTATDNLRAQAVYRRVGARRSEWIDFTLAIDG